ncbi:MAG: UpxY family transcription antiterminator [Nitrospirota bacterium]|nr:UpxY family transcription antiterminator [Nitrospirota bacterium]
MGEKRYKELVKPRLKTTASWYAVHTKARHEFLVADHLTGAGIEFLLPSVVVTRKWKDRNKRVRFPLFPGYLFVHLEQDHTSRLAVLKTKGVVRLLGTVPGEPETVPDEQIDALKRIIESELPLDPYPYLHEGQRVRIKRGPLSGVEGILIKKTDQSLFVLSIDIIRQSTSVTIDASEVEEA